MFSGITYLKTKSNLTNHLPLIVYPQL